MIALAASLAFALALAQAPDAGTPAVGGALAVRRISYELADGGIVALPALADGGVVAVVLTPEKATALANERQLRDWQLAEANKQLNAPPPAVSTLAIVVGAVKIILDAVPIVISAVAATRQP